jgi:DNA-binding transcriptional LysR family regulator
MVPAAPQRIDDLRQHACLRMRRSNGSIAPWSFVNGNQAVEVIVSGPFIANDMPTMLGAAVKGLGLAQAPAPVVAGAVKAGSLVGLLQPFTSMAPGLFLYYPGHRQTPPKAACLHRSREGPRGLSANKIEIDIGDKRARRRRRV